MDNLYEGQEYFLLRIDDEEILINEPIGWDKVASKVERDDDAYGFNYEFIDGDISLKFAFGDGGGEALEKRYEEKGSDGAAELEFGILLSATREPQFIGTVNLNDSTDDTEGISCVVEKTIFESKFRTRYDTKVNLDAVKDLDGNPIAPLASIALQLHSKAIVKVAECKNTEPDYDFLDPNAVGTPYGYSLFHWIQPNTVEQTINELDNGPDDTYGIQELPFAITDTDPFIDKRFQYLAPESGNLKIYFQWYSQGGTYYTSPNVIQSGIDGMFQSDTPYGPNANAWDMFVIVERGSSKITSLSLPAVDSSHSQLLAQTFYIDVEVGDRVYVGIKVTHSQTKKGAYTDTWFNTLRFTQETKAPASGCKSYRILDVLNQIVYATTGQRDRVVSDYFGVGGAGRNYVLTSGYALRNFDPTTEKPVQADAKKTFSSLQAIFNTGVGFMQVNGEYYLRVEPMLHYFGRGVALILKSAYDWQEYHDKASTYNEIDIGYDKYATDEYNTLDEANTEQSWLLPITTYKNKLVQKSSFISSGYSIEMQRREQYKKNPSTSLGNDDALFIVACTDSIVYPSMPYIVNALDKSILFQKPVSLNVDDSVVLASSNVGTFRVASINHSQPNSYILDNVYASEVATKDVSILLANVSGPTVYAERNQYFDVMDNITDPASVYNARILPHRNLYAWAPKLNIALRQKPDTSLITNTFAKNNGLVVTRLSVSSPNKRLEGTRQIEEKGSIVLSDFLRSSAPYGPKKMQFKSRVAYSAIKDLVKSLRGEQDVLTQKNYGQLVAPDKTGVAWLCVVQSVKYSYATGEAEFIVNKVEPY